jgi:hypothetical protein
MADGQSTYDINIRTAADLRAAEALKRSLDGAAKSAKEMGRDTAELQKRLDAADKALNSNAARAIKLQENLKRASDSTRALGKDTSALDAQLKSIGGSSPLLGGGILGLLKGGVGQFAAFTGASLSLLGALRAVNNGIQEYAQAEDQLNAMQVALASQGKYSREAAEGLAQLAGQLEQKTNIGDGTWLGALTKLIQYGGSTDNLQELGDTLKNIAGILDGDVNAAATLMIRALNGNYRGFQQLGFAIDKNATDLERWRSIVDQSARGGDILENRTKTLDGSWKRLTLSLGNVTKGLGQSVAEGINLRGIINLLSDGVTKLANAIGFTVPQVDDLRNSQNALNRSLEDSGESLEQQRERFKKMGDAAEKAAKNIDAVKKAIQQMQQQDDAEADAKMNMELALVDDEESRTGNKLGAARKRARIHARYSAERARRANESDIAQLAIDNRAAGQLLGQRGSLSESERKLRSDIQGASALSPLLTRKSEADDAVRAAQEKLKLVKLLGGSAMAGALGGGMSVGAAQASPYAIQAAQKQLAEAQARAAQLAQEAAAAQDGTRFKFNSASDVQNFLRSREGALGNVLSERERFEGKEGEQLNTLQLGAASRMSAYQSRNRIYGFQSATSVVQSNTTERGIRDQLAQQALSEGGKSVGAYKELADQSRYMAGQISEGNKEFFKLLQQLSTDYRVNTGLLQEFRRDLSDINARARKGRELN